MEKKDRLDLALPAAILALGQMLPSPREWSARRGAGSPFRRHGTTEGRLSGRLLCLERRQHGVL
jgi:hypothetical protein